MKITSKGQVTIPADIRQKAGLLPETEVEFKLQRGQVVIRKAADSRRRGRKLVEDLLVHRSIPCLPTQGSSGSR